jgi:hypothetical protein
MNILYSLFGLFLVRKVDSILTEMATGVARLEKSIEQHDGLADKYAVKANKFNALKAEAESEAERAHRVANKLRDLLS